MKEKIACTFSSYFNQCLLIPLHTKSLKIDPQSSILGIDDISCFQLDYSCHTDVLHKTNLGFWN